MVAGIDVDAAVPGYKRVIIRPQPGGGLTYASAGYDSIYGRIESKWALTNDTFQLTGTIPPNSEGIVHLPAQAVEEITEAGRSLAQVEGIREIRQEGDEVIVTVGSGHYDFCVAKK